MNQKVMHNMLRVTSSWQQRQTSLQTQVRPEAFVEGIYEGVEWVMENGILKAVELEAMQKQIRTVQSVKNRGNQIKFMEKVR